MYKIQNLTAERFWRECGEWASAESTFNCKESTQASMLEAVEVSLIPLVRSPYGLGKVILPLLEILRCGNTWIYLHYQTPTQQHQSRFYFNSTYMQYAKWQQKWNKKSLKKITSSLFLVLCPSLRHPSHLLVRPPQLRGPVRPADHLHHPLRHVHGP